LLQRLQRQAQGLAQRFSPCTEPIAYRKQNGGDYDIPALTLRADVAPAQVGFAAHVEQP